MPRLEVFRKGRRVSDDAVPPEGVVLGRDEQARIRLDDKVASRSHARIYPSEGAWIIEDLATTNGTWVNGVREYRRALKQGDRIEIGPFVVTWVQAPDERVPPDAKPPGPTIVAREEKGPGTELRRNDDPDRTKGLDPKQAARIREEARLLMGPHLVQVGGQDLLHPLRKAENVIGTGESASIRIEGTGRAEAAVLEYRPDGSLLARRLGWFSKMKVNGVAVKEAVVADGAEIELGTVKLRFVGGPK